jgi:D-beta-D-heptose 7-phosphate kinase/D-beta-D-heptose 1-phosphate adenosyltransferase
VESAEFIIYGKRGIIIIIMKKKISNRKTKKAGKKVVMVSGGFDPVHVGHLDMFKEAKELGDELVVVLNNDNWLKLKKGHTFMSEQDRKEIIESFKFVDRVLITSHEPNTKDISVCRELELLKPNIFANGGDRKEDNIPEYELCKRLGIEMVFGVGKKGKIRSSSDLVKQAIEKKIDFYNSIKGVENKKHNVIK